MNVREVIEKLKESNEDSPVLIWDTLMKDDCPITAIEENADGSVTIS